jgi:hypothetical protein
MWVCGRLQLFPANQGRATHLGKPHATQWVTKSVKENDVYVMFQGHYHSLRGDHGLVGYHNRFHLEGRNIKHLFLLLQTKTFILLGYKSPGCIYDQLHHSTPLEPCL